MDHRQRPRNNKISDEIRGLITNSMNNGTTVNNKIYSTYRRTQNTTKKIAGHRQQKLSDAPKEQICDWVDEDCSLTLQQLKTKCLTQWPNINQISLEPFRIFIIQLKEFHSFPREETHLISFKLALIMQFSIIELCLKGIKFSSLMSMEFK
jgi:hypothetical protein